MVKKILQSNPPRLLVGKHNYYSEDGFHVSGSGRAKIGNYCAIGRNFLINTSDHNLSLPAMQYALYSKYFDKYPGGGKKGPVIIGSDVWIGNNVNVLKNVNVGDGACIGSGAVVTKDVPPYAIVAGVPAKIIRYRFSEEVIKFLLELTWWDWDDEKIKRNREFFHTDLNSLSLEEIKKIIV